MQIYGHKFHLKFCQLKVFLPRMNANEIFVFLKEREALFEQVSCGLVVEVVEDGAKCACLPDS